MQALQNKSDAIEHGSLWDQLMRWMREKPRPITEQYQDRIPWPDDHIDCDLHSMVRWANAPLRRKHVLVKKLGSGSFGAVYEAKNIVDGSSVAVKISTSESDSWGGVKQFSAFEIGMLSRCQSDYVVKLHDAFINVSLSILVMELMPMTMHARVSRNPLTRPESNIVVNNLWNAINVVHVRGCVHRDIKSNNVLVSGVDQEIVAKLSDFGRACTHVADVMTSQPNPMYSLDVRPPEFLFAYDAVWHQERVTYSTRFCTANCFKSDVFAMAACIVPLIGGPSFGGDCEWRAGRRVCELLSNAANAPGMFNKALAWNIPNYQGMVRSTEFSRWAHDMIWPSSVLMINPHGRATAKDVLASIGAHT